MTSAQWNEATEPAATFHTVPGRRLARAVTGWIGVSAVVAGGDIRIGPGRRASIGRSLLAGWH
jgi:hypothetical protein